MPHSYGDHHILVHLIKTPNKRVWRKSQLSCHQFSKVHLYSDYCTTESKEVMIRPYLNLEERDQIEGTFIIFKRNSTDFIRHTHPALILPRQKLGPIARVRMKTVYDGRSDSFATLPAFIRISHQRARTIHLVHKKCLRQYARVIYNSSQQFQI